ncbi:tRNA epoxyqueuosine(34) reductase QueG [bacterium]|nr:MAG: tRNA epoxyqueuosine(34) reductase QueG [bacterium]
MQKLEVITESIRRQAYSLGFEACGFSKVRQLDEQARKLEEWLHAGKHGTMSWMENHFDKRINPAKLVPGAKTVVSVLCQYRNEQSEKAHLTEGVPKISKYALGDDYHDVLKEKLFELFAFTREQIGAFEGRVFVDSAPVLDKAWAVESGLGWIGKNSNILNKSLGSWFFIGEMIIDAELQYDHPTTNHCGTCTKCIDSCPTQAIYEPMKVDANKCISYLTIELRESIPADYHTQMGNWMYGCDICQDVCPWNRKAAYGKETQLFPREALLNQTMDFWEELDIPQFQELFRKSAVKRTKYSGLHRNIQVVRSNLQSK